MEVPLLYRLILLLPRSLPAWMNDMWLDNDYRLVCCDIVVPPR